jgi:hypothetical protein
LAAILGAPGGVYVKVGKMGDGGGSTVAEGSGEGDWGVAAWPVSKACCVCSVDSCDPASTVWATNVETALLSAVGLACTCLAGRLQALSRIMKNTGRKEDARRHFKAFLSWGDWSFIMHLRFATC